MSAKLTLITATIVLLFAVALGAFGAHAFKPYLLQIGRLETFETAVKYQFYHGFALLFLGILMLQFSNQWLIISAYLFLTGIIIFSGSLYALCATQVNTWGAVTPLGGISFMLGWLLMGYGIYTSVGK